MKDKDTSPAPEDESWFADLADSAVASPERDTTWQEQTIAVDPAVFLPPVSRPRPERRPLVPQAVWISIASGMAALVVIGIAIALLAGTGRTLVPSVTGVPLTVANTRLAAVGLQSEVEERRFSSEPVGMVLGQEPADGTEMRKGDVVKLIVSAGSEDFPMPDVIGDGLPLALGTLEGKGLVVTVETVASDGASGTVLSSTPAPGALVRTGDRVSLQVAGGSSTGVSLQPYLLQGVSVTIDPAVVPSGTPDVSLEVAKRLRSLLEASGALVTILRTGSDTSTAEVVRAQAAAQTTATVAVGFDLSPPSSSGRLVESPSVAEPVIITDSARLASAVTSELVSVAPPARSGTTAADTVLAATKAPFVRVRLGSPLAREDQALFADPTWADKVARAVYTALGKTYGAVEQQ